MIATAKNRSWREWVPVALAIVLLIAAVGYYGHRLTAWQAYDDEGGYMYASWRISLGEMPYRDFLTPQLPVFLYPGALVMKLFDGSVAAFRYWAMLQTLFAAALLWLAVDRLHGRWTATVAMALMLADRDIFWAARFFRPEAPMLLFGMLGFNLLILARQKDSRALAVATGVAFGLATMSKLFGGLLIFGVGLWLLYDGIRGRQWRIMFRDGLLIAAGYAGAVVVVGGIGLLMSRDFVAYVLGHHVRQGAGTPLREVITKTLLLYREYAFGMKICFATGGIGFILALLQKDRLKALFAWQIPTLLAFFLMTRHLGQRHLTYVMPSVAACAAVGIVWLWQKVAGQGGAGRKVLATVYAVFVIAVAILPHAMINENVRAWSEDDTTWWREFLQAEIGEDQTLVSDYPGLNFVARRASTRLAAGISGGAASSGQITGADIIEEIEAHDVPIVLLNVAQGAHQFVAFVDFDEFKTYLQTQMYLMDRHVFDYRLIEIYAREDLWPGDVPLVDFGHQLLLTGTDLGPAYSVGEGRYEASIGLRWQSLAQMPFEYSSSLRVLDDAGNEWGLGSKKMVDIDKGIYYDPEGHPLAVLYPTTEWALHEQSVQHQEIPVDQGTPPGTYDVVLRVHREGQWIGVPAVESDGTAVGYDLPLGQLVVPAPDANTDLAGYDMDVRVDVPMSSDVSLVSRRAIVESVLPGDVLSLRFLWGWRGAAAADTKLSIVLEPSNGDAIQMEVPLLSPGWQDEPVTDDIRLSVEAYNLAVPRDVAPGQYDLKVMVEQDSVDGPWLTLSQVTVPEYERETRIPEHLDILNVRLGDAMWLAAGGVVAKDNTVHAELAWQCQEPVDRRYTVFCHLVGAEGSMLAQADITPGEGMAPTTSWVEGQVIHDIVTLTPAEGTNLRDAKVLVGMYDPLTGLRLPVFDAAGRAMGDHVMLPVGE